MIFYRIGLTLAILGWLFSLNPYWLIFASPFFLAGVVILWFSKASFKKKVLTTVIPLLLWYPGMITFFYLSSNRMKTETFLIPKDFRGQITLVYDEPCGAKLPEIDGRLVYKIPSSGVMIIQNEFETGIIDHEYYFVDESGNRIEKIPILIQQDFNEEYILEKNRNVPAINKIGLFLLGSGSGSTFKNKDYKFHMMAVNSWDSLKVQMNAPGDSIVDEILYNCRGGKNFR